MRLNGVAAHRDSGFSRLGSRRRVLHDDRPELGNVTKIAALQAGQRRNLPIEQSRNIIMERNHGELGGAASA